MFIHNINKEKIMKKYMYFEMPFALLLFILIVVSGCGGNEPAAEKEGNKPTAADMFKDEHPAYDAKAINAGAPVSEVTLRAVGTTMADMSYDSKLVTVKAGSTVKLKFINTFTDASMPHNWVLVHFGTMEAVATAGMAAGKDASYVPNTNDVLIATKMLGPKEETEITFPAPPAGKYQFVCTYPGHWSIMNGEFIVE